MIVLLPVGEAEVLGWPTPYLQKNQKGGNLKRPIDRIRRSLFTLKGAGRCPESHGTFVHRG